MSKEETSLQKGATKLRKVVHVDLTIFLDAEESVQDLVSFIAEFFCEMGDYEHIQFSVDEEKDLLMVPQEDVSN